MTKIGVTTNFVTTGGLSAKDFEKELKTLLENSSLDIESVEVQGYEELEEEEEEEEEDA